MFDFGTKTYVMGILNITPDSFSGDGLLGEAGLETAVYQAKQFVADGADILDPGVGFGKTRQHNIQIVHELQKFKSLGFPILLGTSRKSFIGYTLELPPNERMEGTAATVTLGMDRGADIVRVHD